MNGVKYLLLLSTVFVGLIFGGCSKEEEVKSKNCIPTSLVYANDDSVAYRYGASGEFLGLSVYSLYDEYTLTERIDVINNGSNLPVTIERVYVLADGSEEFVSSQEIVYDGSGRPESMSWYDTPDKLHPQVLQFTYNPEGQLASLQNVEANIRYTYEYNSMGNLIKIYFESDYYGKILARENVEFDNGFPFYSGSPGLAVLNTLVFRYPPDKNNPLTSILYFQNGTLYNPPTGRTVSFSLTYNTERWPVSILDSEVDLVTAIKKIEYSCK